jgi:hypothetical protein
MKTHNSQSIRPGIALLMSIALALGFSISCNVEPASKPAKSPQKAAVPAEEAADQGLTDFLDEEKNENMIEEVQATAMRKGDAFREQFGQIMLAGLQNDLNNYGRAKWQLQNGTTISEREFGRATIYYINKYIKQMDELIKDKTVPHDKFIKKMVDLRSWLAQRPHHVPTSNNPDMKKGIDNVVSVKVWWPSKVYPFGTATISCRHIGKNGRFVSNTKTKARMNLGRLRFDQRLPPGTHEMICDRLYIRFK